MVKTKRNNFDKSSTGTDIECSCFYDTDMSRMNFEENFKMLQHNSYSTTSVAYYIDNGNVPDDSKVKFIVKGTREVREKYFLDNGRYYNAEEVKAWDDETLNEEILSNEEDVNLINYALERIPDTVEGLEFVPNKNLIVLATCGYSQGDYAAVNNCPDDLEKAWGKMPEQKDIQALVNHLFWDAPIYCQVTINGKEYSYYDAPEYDDYKWNRDEFIKYVSKESGIKKENLENFIPENPEYN